MKTLEEMTAELEQAIVEFEADTGESGDEIWYDLVVATAWSLLAEEGYGEEVLALAREFCRTQVGSIPHDLEPVLGRKDWIR